MSAANDPVPLRRVTYLRAPEVAEILSISRTAAYRLIESGTIPHIRIGRSVRVPYQSLMDYLALHEIPAREEEPRTA